MANKVGPLIKEARTSAGLTQEQLAKKIDNVTAADISKAERGEKELTQTALKQIAKLTGVTQSSLIEAAKASTYKTSSSTAKKTTSAAKKATSTAKKTTTAKKTDEFKLTSTEKKLVELYRAADSDTKKKVTGILKGESTGAEGILNGLLGSLDGVDLSSLTGMLGKK